MDNKISPEIIAACSDWDPENILRVIDFNNPAELEYLFNRVSKSISSQRENLQETSTSLLTLLLSQNHSFPSQNSAIEILQQNYLPVSKSMNKDEIRYNIFGRLFFCASLIRSNNSPKILEKCLNILIELAAEKCYVWAPCVVLFGEIYEKCPELFSQEIFYGIFKIFKEINSDFFYLILKTKFLPENFPKIENLKQPQINEILMSSRSVHPNLHPIWEECYNVFGAQTVLKAAKEMLFSGDESKFQGILAINFVIEKNAEEIFREESLILTLENLINQKNDFSKTIKDLILTPISEQELDLNFLAEIFREKKAYRIFSAATSSSEPEKILELFDDSEFLAIFLQNFSGNSEISEKIAKKLVLQNPEKSNMKIWETLCENYHIFSELFEILKEFSWNFTSKIAAQEQISLKNRILNEKNPELHAIFSLIYLRFSQDYDFLSEVFGEISNLDFSDENFAIISILIQFLNIPSKIYRKFNEKILSQIFQKLDQNSIFLLNSAIFGIEETLEKGEKSEETEEADESESSEVFSEISDFSEKNSESSESSEASAGLDIDENMALGEIYDLRAASFLRAKKIAANQVEARKINNKNLISFLIELCIKNADFLNSWRFFNAMLSASSSSKNSDFWLKTVQKFAKNLKFEKIEQIDEFVEEISEVPESFFSSNFLVKNISAELLVFIAKILDAHEVDYYPLVFEICEVFMTIKKIFFDEKDLQILIKKLQKTKFPEFFAEGISEIINEKRTVSDFIFLKSVELLALISSFKKIPQNENFIKSLQEIAKMKDLKRRKNCAGFVLRIVASMGPLEENNKEILREILPVFPGLKKYLE